MDDLKTTLFDLTHKALTRYSEANAELESNRGYGPGWEGLRRICSIRQQRFCALWDVIEAAGLTDEYENWRNKQPEHG